MYIYTIICHCYHCYYHRQCSIIKDKFQIEYEGNYYPAGEGKGDCDRVAGRVYRYKRGYLQKGQHINGDVSHLLESLKNMDNCTLYVIDIPTNKTKVNNKNTRLELITESGLNMSKITQYKFENGNVLAKLASNEGEWHTYTFKHNINKNVPDSVSVPVPTPISLPASTPIPMPVSHTHNMQDTISTNKVAEPSYQIIKKIVQPAKNPVKININNKRQKRKASQKFHTKRRKC
jgi:hypothetical protein